MTKKDGRALPHALREEIRKRAVERVLLGESPEQVIAALGFHRSCIYAWLAKYRAGGEQALGTKPIAGRPRKIPERCVEELRELIKSDPRQLGFHDALWTREMIRELLARKFDVKVSMRSIGNVLQQLGIKVRRKPLKECGKEPRAIKHWREESWPEIQQAAKMAKAQIYFGDESSIRFDCHRGATACARGQTTAVENTDHRFRVNLISAISSRGEQRFMATAQRLTVTVFIDFLQRLLHGAERPVFLIVEGHPVHRRKRVCDYVESTEGKLKLFVRN